jgi:mannan endo-1,4-beta-mannosidase
MDVYVNQLIGSGRPHDLFYTNANVIVSRSFSLAMIVMLIRAHFFEAAYKNYVKTFVSRYVNEPTIMAWELANEPRCSGSTG